MVVLERILLIAAAGTHLKFTKLAYLNKPLQHGSSKIPSTDNSSDEISRIFNVLKNSDTPDGIVLQNFEM